MQVGATAARGVPTVISAGEVTVPASIMIPATTDALDVSRR